MKHCNLRICTCICEKKSQNCWQFRSHEKPYVLYSLILMYTVRKMQHDLDLYLLKHSKVHYVPKGLITTQLKESFSKGSSLY